MIWLRVLALGAFLALAGCASVGWYGDQLSSEEIALRACSKYERTLSTLTALYVTGHLSAGDANTVDRWERVVTPLCSAEEPPTGEVAMAVLDQALLELLLIRPQGE